MVKFLSLIFQATERCGPLCRRVQDEVASMGRADAIERNVRTKVKD